MTKDRYKTRYILRTIDNHYIFALVSVVAFFIGGILTGAITSALTKDIEGQAAIGYLKNALGTSNNILPWRVFMVSMWQSAQLVILMFLLSFTPIGIFSSVGVMGLKGFTYGYTMVIFIRQYKINGLLFSCACILPKTLLQFLILGILAIFCIRFCIDGIKNRRVEGQGKRLFVISIITFLLLMLVCLYEGYLNSYLIKWLGSYFLKI